MVFQVLLQRRTSEFWTQSIGKGVVEEGVRFRLRTRVYTNARRLTPYFPSRPFPLRPPQQFQDMIPGNFGAYQFSFLPLSWLTTNETTCTGGDWMNLPASV